MSTLEREFGLIKNFQVTFLIQCTGTQHWQEELSDFYSAHVVSLHSSSFLLSSLLVAI